jgi:4-hydroxy-2-oxoheptanedioate aldolase
MKTTKGKAQKKLDTGQIASVLKCNLADPRSIEIAGLCGVDAVWLCNEHVPQDYLNLENQIRAARLYGMDSIVRVSKDGYSSYIRPLEAGASGIMVPHVTTATEAAAIVQMVRFHPEGKRAVDGGNVDGDYALLPIDEYMQRSNESCLIVLQIESPEALENIEEISKTDGFNALFFGPGDFSHRIGKAGNLSCKEVLAARNKVREAAMRNGKFLMSTGGEGLLDFREANGGLQVIGADVVGLSSYIKANLRSTFGDSLTTDGYSHPSPYDSP